MLLSCVSVTCSSGKLAHRINGRARTHTTSSSPSRPGVSQWEEPCSPYPNDSNTPNLDSANCWAWVRPEHEHGWLCVCVESLVPTHSALWDGSKQFSKERPCFCPSRATTLAGLWTLGTWDPQCMVTISELCSGKNKNKNKNPQNKGGCRAEVQATLRSSRRVVPTARHLQGVW